MPCSFLHQEEVRDVGAERLQTVRWGGRSCARFTARWCDALTHPTPARSFPQTPSGYSAFEQHLLTMRPAPATILIVLEATGRDWVTLAVTLDQAGFAVSVVHPNHVHNDAKSLAQRAKTDARDADLLAHVARERQPLVWTPQPAVYHELRQRLVAHDALLEMPGTAWVQAGTHRHALRQWPIQVAAVKEHLDVVIADFDQRIAA